METRIYRTTFKDCYENVAPGRYIDPELKKLVDELNATVFMGRIPLDRMLFLAFVDMNQERTKKIFGGICTPRNLGGNKYYGIGIEYAVKDVDPAQFRQIVIHELVHAMLWVEGKPYKDSEKDFIFECGWYHGARYHTLSREIKAFDYASVEFDG